MSKYKTSLKKLISYKLGNNKLPDSTLIFNLTPASVCFGKLTGKCQMIGQNKRCYAERDEIVYKSALNYRLEQAFQWDSLSAEDFAVELAGELKRAFKPEITAIRFNEAGEIRNLADLAKIIKICQLLADFGHGDIKVYLYTSRNDLFEGVNLNSLPDNLTVNGSNWDAHNNFKCVSQAEADEADGFVCPCDCKKCRKCQIRHGETVYDIIH